jgi:hypothetical protein
MMTGSRMVLLSLVLSLLVWLGPAQKEPLGVRADGLASVTCSAASATASTCTVTLNNNLRAGGSLTAVLQPVGATFGACTASVAGQTCTISSTGASVALTCGTVDCAPGSQFQETVLAGPAIAQQQFFMVTSASGVQPPLAQATSLPASPPLAPPSTGGGLCVNGSIRTPYGCTSLYSPFYGAAGYAGPGYVTPYGYPYGYLNAYSSYLPGYGYNYAWPTGYVPGTGWRACFAPGRGNVWVPLTSSYAGLVC